MPPDDSYRPAVIAFVVGWLLAIATLLLVSGCGADPAGPTLMTRTCVDRPTTSPIASECS